VEGTGYLSWLRSDGSALDSPAACHSYAVHKATPGPSPESLFQQACSSLLGSFSTDDTGARLRTWGSLTENRGAITDADHNVATTLGNHYRPPATPGFPPPAPGSLAGSMWAGTGPGNLGYGLVRCTPNPPG
jgi:hypothetical protein